MGKTRKNNNGSWGRNTRFQYKQKRVQGARSREFRDYDGWDSPRRCKLAREGCKIAVRMHLKGWSAQKIMDKLRFRYGCTIDEARDMLPWDLRKD
jgi:hypothetical protein